MAMQCACVTNPEETQILQPCLLHSLWARSVAMGEFAARVEQAEAPPKKKVGAR